MAEEKYVSRNDTTGALLISKLGGTEQQEKYAAGWAKIDWSVRAEDEESGEDGDE